LYLFENKADMKKIALVLGLVLSLTASLFGQSTTTSGTWNDGSIWSGGTAPNGSGTVTVDHVVELNRNLSISGNYTFNNSVLDFAGGTAYTLSLTGSGSLTVAGGTSNFEGVTASMTANGSSITVQNGATLIITGATAFANGTVVNIQAGGTLIINGDFENNIAGAGSFTVEGTVIINGNYQSNGNVDILGGGDFFTTGSITTTGMSGEVFGFTQDCPTGPCSGRNLCLGGNVNVIATANQYLCSGSSHSALNADAVASATYQWQSSTTSSISGFTNISGATSEDFNPSPTPTQTTWYRRRATVGGCTGTSSAKVITIIPAGSWRGITSTDWNTNSNWCGSAQPTISTDVVIPTGVPNMPIISTAGEICRNLTVNSGATLTINAANTLSLNGNLINNGNIITTGTMSFDGSTAQTVSGSGSNVYARLTINNSSGAVPAVTFSNAAVNVTTMLSMTQGVVNMSGFNITLGTSASSTGTLTYAAGRIYNGNITRWFPTTTITLGNTAGHFPIGSSGNYRPFFVGYSSALTTGGTLRVNHTETTGAANVSFTDNPTATVISKRSNSFWNISSGNSIAGGGSNFNLRGEGTGFGTVADVNHLRLTLSGSTVGTHLASAGTTTNPQISRSGLTLSTDLNNDNYYFGSTNGLLSPLPVTLVNFTGQITNEGVALTWATLTEENAHYFDIEKSTNGIDFEPIGRKEAKGSSTTRINYTFIDDNTNFSKAYYRLKSVDFAIGNVPALFAYSDVIAVEKFGLAGASLMIYPNPVTDRKLTVQVGDGSATEGSVGLYDLSGKELMLFSRSNVQGEYELGDNLPSGLYLLRVYASHMRHAVKVIIK
jgi:hypothetical protein